MRSPCSERPRRRVLALAAALAASVGAGAVLAPAAGAVNFVTTANGERWEVNDGAMPGLDTGSIRSVTSASLLGYGGLRISVSGAPPARMDGELMRGFGLRFDGIDTFATTTPVNLSGIDVARELRLDATGNSTRFVDRFTNRTNMPKTVEVTFGGILGQNNRENQSEVVNSANGDTAISSPTAGSRSRRRPRRPERRPAARPRTAPPRPSSAPPAPACSARCSGRPTSSATRSPTRSRSAPEWRPTSTASCAASRSSRARRDRWRTS
ncbi:hypothetical protein VSS74_20735 [Conexibacter stalactiti]|uniref:Uncharacterized protein n=1 Tax=Conexibacter stalactiti TaxID=1940611 RepID=A0ABU4HTY6_9ACTN|nr:hypothetical protein [Conexibacter stalactiti]MDW5596785.1 hypothetical protein [Conexibacter stalactiti]MEC5037427.1 hypothetical protein [Conexibacter stalactiti]